jgi:hypothetical protein
MSAGAIKAALNRHDPGLFTELLALVLGAEPTPEAYQAFAETRCAALGAGSIECSPGWRVTSRVFGSSAPKPLTRLRSRISRARIGL